MITVVIEVICSGERQTHVRKWDTEREPCSNSSTWEEVGAGLLSATSTALLCQHSVLPMIWFYSCPLPLLVGEHKRIIYARHNQMFPFQINCQSSPPSSVNAQVPHTALCSARAQHVDTALAAPGTLSAVIFSLPIPLHQRLLQEL